MYTLVAAIFESIGKQELHTKGSVFVAYLSLQVIVYEGMLSVTHCLILPICLLQYMCSAH